MPWPFAQVGYLDPTMMYPQWIELRRAENKLPHNMRSIPDKYDPSSQVEFQKREKSEFGETKRDISRTTLVSNPNQQEREHPGRR